LGPLFTVLSEGSTVLPYRVDVSKADSPHFEILGKYNRSAKSPVFSPTPTWRLIATINTVDKASLYQMSYALSRRFAWIFVDVPSNLDAFVRTFVATRKSKPISGGANDATVLGRIWAAVNAVRPLGAAPFIDVIRYCLTVDNEFDFGLAAGAEHSNLLTYLDAFRVQVMPMLDGVGKDEMEAIWKAVCGALGIVGNGATLLRQQMLSIAL
jgi:5-methylcytosine-specific restriction protein B